ncbi:MAG: aminopeptidase P family N-terminal domain-containing protein, partial [Bacillota bacterium]
MGIVPLEEIEYRINRLQQSLLKNELDGALILENTNLYYLTGSIFEGFLYVPVEGKPLLMVKRGLERVVKESPLTNILSIKSSRDLGVTIQECHPLPVRLGLELDVLPARDYLRYQKLFSTTTQLIDLSKIIRELRLVKSSYE